MTVFLELQRVDDARPSSILAPHGTRNRHRRGLAVAGWPAAGTVSAMRMWVLEGDDVGAISARRAELLAAQDGSTVRDDVDVSLDNGSELVAAVSSPGLFSPQRLVAADNIEAISDGNLTRLADAGTLSDATVVARSSGPLPAALRKKLGAFATIEAHKTPNRARDAAAAVDRLARAAGITLDRDAKAVLAERATHDSDRVRSVLTQLSLAGISRPKERQVRLLAGDGVAPGVPWAVTDALERGDAAAALRAAGTVEAMVVLSWLGSQLEGAGLILDAGADSPDAAAVVLGKSRFAAERTWKLARRMGREGLTESWGILLDAQLAARGGTAASVALELALARLAPRWGAAARRRS